VDSIQLSIDTNGIPFQKEKQTSSTLDVVTIFVGTRNGKNTASTYYPWGVVVDGSNNMYISDYENHVIRKISPQGTETKISPTRFNIPFRNLKDMAIDREGVLYIVDSGNHRIRQIGKRGKSTIAGGPRGYEDGPVSSAKFNHPYGIALDSFNNIYVSDSGNFKIRKISQDQGVVSTIAENLKSLTSITIDKEGNLFVCDSHQIKKFPKQVR